MEIELNKDKTYQNYIKYYPHIYNKTGSKQTSFLLSQLEYWFSKFKNGFYKFLEPSNQKTYKEGDSWSEELGISRKTFTKAFDEIGIRYKSKTAFNEANDKFQGKSYASYYNRQTKQTIFLRNNEVANAKFNSLFKPEITLKKNIDFEDTRSLNLLKEEEEKKQKNSCKNTLPNNSKAENSNKNMPFYNGKNYRSRYIYKYIYIQKNTQTKKPSNLNLIPNIEKNQENELVRKIKNIWIEQIGDLGKHTCKVSKIILDTFLNIFNGSFEKWKEYCSKIATSDFLMGKTKSAFKIWILWALKKETYDRVNAGDLGVIETKQDHMETEKNDVLKSIILNHSEKNIQESFQEISKNINPVRFKSWFKGMKVEKIENGTAFLKTENNLASDFIKKNFSSDILFSFHKFNSEINKIEIYS